MESRSRSPKLSTTPNDDDQSDTSLQFQMSYNEEVDDGIEADVGDSTNEDDDPVFRTPAETDSSIIEVYSLYKDIHQALYHLNNKLIATYEPEIMRGGGLLVSIYSRNYFLLILCLLFRNIVIFWHEIINLMIWLS
jgi:hypothetical protein